MSKWGDNIKRLRLQKGMTQNKLAKLAGIAQPALWGIETSVKNPSVESIQRIADALNVPVGDLFSGPGEKIHTQADDNLTPKEKRFINDYRTLNDKWKKYISQQITIAKKINSMEADLSNGEKEE